MFDRFFIVSSLCVLNAATSYAQLVPGATVTLRGNNDRFLSAENGTVAMTCNRLTTAATERFVVVDAGGGKVALRGSNNQYVSSEFGLKAMMCNRTAIGDWEKFTAVNVGGGKIALKSSNDKFVSCEFGAVPINANRATDELWEWFNIDIVSTGKTINAATEITAAGGNAAIGLRNAITKAGPGGTVNVTTDITVTDHIFIETPGVTINGNNTGIIREGGLGQKNLFNIRACDITFRNIQLIGEATNTNYRALIELTGAEDFTASSVTFKNAVNHISSFFKPANGLNVDRCTFDKGFHGVLLLRDVVRITSTKPLLAATNGGRQRITNSTFRNMENAISLDGGNDGSDGTSTFPDRTNPLRAQVRNKTTKYIDGSGRRGVISGNTMTGVKTFGIALATIEGIDCNNNNITMSTTPSSYSQALHLEHTTQNCDFNTNTLDARGSVAGVSCIAVATFNDFGNPSTSLNGCRNLRFVGNKLFANTGSGFFGDGFTNMSLINNDLNGVTSNRLYLFFETPDTTDAPNSFGTRSGNLPTNP